MLQIICHTPQFRLDQAFYSGYFHSIPNRHWTKVLVSKTLIKSIPCKQQYLIYLRMQNKQNMDFPPQQVYICASLPQVTIFIFLFCFCWLSLAPDIKMLRTTILLALTGMFMSAYIMTIYAHMGNLAMHWNILLDKCSYLTFRSVLAWR